MPDGAVRAFFDATSGDSDVETVTGVGEEASVGVAEAVCVGKGVTVGGSVSVGSGVKLSTTGWNGVGVAVAFGSTVTRLMG